MHLGWFSDDARLARLTRRAQRGNREAFRALYRALYPRVAKFVGRRVRSRPDAEDLVSGVFERLVDRLDSVVPDLVSAFALTLARNAVYDHARTLHPVDPIDAVGEIAAGGVDPLGRMLADEELSAVAAALKSLSEAELEVVSLRLGDGLRHREIAAVLGVSEEAVKQRFRRALLSLREGLSPLHLRGGLAHETD